ncbi:MAG TPA: glycoside hydrolase family 38 C-terminal domain-containing protein [Puia sp.]
MKNLLFPVLLSFVLGAVAQTKPSVSAGQTAYFIDGYHGGIYGHLPSWQTNFMVEKLAKYPDWKINLELEPESWDTIKVNDPESYVAFQKLFADQSSKGRIEYVNPNYGQSYLYNISGESVIRQFYYGMKKLRQHFPEAQFTTYSSEEPCFTSALPQILRSYGFSYASLKNPNTCWGGYTRAYGGELVNWIGPDGSRILTAPRYEVEALKPGSIWETIASCNSEEYVRKAFAYGIRHPVGMCLQDAGWAFGPWLRGANVVGAGGNGSGSAGNGGSGGGNGSSSGNGVYAPTVYVTWRGYFANVSNGKADRDWKFSQEDVLVGLMWGAQVLQRIAREVRQSENAIIRAEKLAALAKVWKGSAWPDATFEAAWRTLLLSQHHDCWIVPYNGKKGDTWADKVVKWTGFTDVVSDSITRTAMRQLSGDSGRLSGGVSRLSGDSGLYVRVFNTTAVPRDELVRYRDKLFRAKVPPMGYASYRLNALPPVNGGSVSSVKGASVVRFDNGVYKVETDLYRILIDPAKGGAITSWVAKKLGNKEFVEEGKRFNELRGNFYNAGGMRSGSETAAEVEIIENGPAGIKLAIMGSLADNPFTQVLTVQEGQPRVDIHLTIDWKGNPAIGEYFEVPKNEEVRKSYYDDRFKLLALFPLRLSSQKVYKNAPFDVTESKLANTFYNRWDSIKNNVLLNWVDVEDGAGEYGMALFCDHTTSYAHGEDFPLGLTVQYSGNGIFYRNYTVDGPSEMNYALIPHAGKWDKAGIWTEGTKWNEPLIATAATGDGERSLLQTEKGVEISSLTSSGNALLVRLFNAEAKGPLQRLYIGFAATAAVEVELDGRRLKVLPIHSDKRGRRWVELSVPRFGIRTIKFEHV